MIQLSYNPITGTVYHFEPISEMKRRKRRNPKLEKKALEQLTRVVEQASLAMKQSKYLKATMNGEGMKTVLQN